MTNPFDITELKYMIINLLDLKSIGRMIRVNYIFKDFIQDMPIYSELQTCLNYIQHNLKLGLRNKNTTHEKKFLFLHVQMIVEILLIVSGKRESHL